MASPAAVAFPRAVQTLLQQSLRLRDRYQHSEVSRHGLAVATGRLEAQLDRLLNLHFRCPDNQRLAKHLRAIRLMAMARKTWGGNRTVSGARTQEILASVLRTCWQQGRSAIDQFVKLLRSPCPILLEIVPAQPSP